MKWNAQNLHKIFKHKEFSTKQALEQGIPYRKLKFLVELGILSKTSKGVYMLTEAFENQEAVFANACEYMKNPSAICLLSALEYYQLTDLVTSQIWILVPDGKRTRRSDLRLVRCRKAFWDIGIVQKSGFSITSLDRTIVDLFRHHNMVGKNIAIEALKQALQEKQIALPKVFEIAKSLKALNLMLPYLESFS